MSDNLTVFGTDYTGVTGIKAKGTGNGTLTYIRPQGNLSITQNTASGSSLDVSQYATATVAVAGSSNTFDVSISYNNSTGRWEPDSTREQIYTAYQSGKTIFVSGNNPDVIIDGWAFSDGHFTYAIVEESTNGSESFLTEKVYYYDGSGITLLYEGTFGNSDKFVVDFYYDADYFGQNEGAWVPYQTHTEMVEAYSSGKELIPWISSEQDMTYLGYWDPLMSAFVYTIDSYNISGYTYNSKMYRYSANGVVLVNENDFDIVNAQSKTVSPTTSQQTVTPDTDQDYNCLSSVTINAMPLGTAGTPTASAGTVTNHAVSVTPSVTNTAGYISGGTKTGTALTISAGDLVSGTLSITSSGTKDVTNYASATVEAGTTGTPMATKSSVSNHSVTVTPSVTNATGFITGGTKTGTAVTVTASELASGNLALSANTASTSCVGYSTVSVTVPFSTIHTSTLSPTSSQGVNGDVWLKTVS